MVSTKTCALGAERFTAGKWFSEGSVICSGHTVQVLGCAHGLGSSIA